MRFVFRILSISVALLATNFCLGQTRILKNRSGFSKKESQYHYQEQPQSLSNGSGLVNGFTFSMMYQPDAKDYGIEFGGNFESIPFVGMSLQLNSNLQFGSDKTTSYGSVYGVGFYPMYIINNTVLIQGKLFPYISLSYVSSPETTIGKKESYHYTYTPTDSSVSYGALLEAEIGFKVAETENNRFFLTTGYKVFASEFKTTDMFKYGYWLLSLTITR